MLIHLSTGSDTNECIIKSLKVILLIFFFDICSSWFLTTKAFCDSFILLVKMDVSLLESDDLVSIIKAMKNEIKMLKEKNGQQEKHIKNIENDLALAKAAAVAAEETLSAFVAVKNTVSSASNCSELDAGNTEQDGDGVPKPLSQLKVQSDGITTNEDQTINNNNEELANSVVKDKPGNTSVISVCVTSSSHEVSTFFSILIY